MSDDPHPISVVCVPWDVTSTFHSGSAQSPQRIESVMHQLDDSHPFSSNVFPVQFLSSNPAVSQLQDEFKASSKSIIDVLNQRGTLSELQVQQRDQINQASVQLNALVFNDVLPLLDSPLILCGGEHGVGVGYIQALAKKHASFSILQLDAHMDCRVAYFGYAHSHASVMTHYASFNSVSSITQVGVRDYAKEECQFQEASSTDFHVFSDYEIHKKCFQGVSWYDGLMTYLCPSTGTPVPGGSSYNQSVYLLDQLTSMKTVIGAELVEVNTVLDNDWDATVGARLIHLLAGCFS